MSDDSTVEPLTLVIDGHTITMELDAWDVVSTAIRDRSIADRNAYKQRQRAAGQVWYALYSAHHWPYAEECFTLQEAEQYLEYGSEEGNLSQFGIVHPDGSFTLTNSFIYPADATLDKEWREVIAKEKASHA